MMMRRKIEFCELSERLSRSNENECPASHATTIAQAKNMGICALANVQISRDGYFPAWPKPAAVYRCLWALLAWHARNTDTG
jgi:hypothetical protein